MMGRMGSGYGSECHLLRWMGRHRNLFDLRVSEALNRRGQPIEWLDFPFAPKNPWPDAEWKGLDFLKSPNLKAAWQEFWPQTGNAQNWDAVGWIGAGPDRELVLVEAKAHLGEISSNCGAKEPSRSIIKTAFERTQKALSITTSSDWVAKYYQYANRIACVHFLHANGVAAHMLFVYFVGDESGSTRKCPQTKNEWEQSLSEQDAYLGLVGGHLLSAYIHKLFLHVSSEEAP